MLGTIGAPGGIEHPTAGVVEGEVSSLFTCKSCAPSGCYVPYVYLVHFFFSQQRCLDDEVRVIVSPQPPSSNVNGERCKTVETPAAKRARLKRERQEEKDRKREAVVKKLDEEIANAALAKAEEQKKSKATDLKVTTAKSCSCSTAIEEAILNELRKSSDDSVSLFLLSLADGLRALPNSKVRQFQMQVLQLLTNFEEDKPGTEANANEKLQLSQDQLVCTTSPLTHCTNL